MRPCGSICGLGCAALATPLGALAFSLLRWRSVPKVALGFLLLSSGFLLIALLPSWRSAMAGAVVANIGAGMMVPSRITWAIATLPAARRGTGTSLWIAASFLGQFSSLIAILGLRGATGSLSAAILVYALACGAAAALTTRSLVPRWLGSRQNGRSIAA